MTRPTTHGLGPPRRPTIRHGDGLPNRPPRREPTAPERARHTARHAAAEGVRAAQGVPAPPFNELRDRLPAHRYCPGAGDPSRRIDPERHIANDPSGPTFLRSAIDEGRQAARALHRRHFAGREASFHFTGTAIGTADCSARFPYPATENWQRALGALVFRLSGAVEAEPEGKQTAFVLDLTIHFEDMHDFNPGAADIGSGIPDEADGVFEITGLARPHPDHGEIERTVSWTGAPTGTPAGMMGAPFDRQRPPQDDRRVRSRV